MQVDQLYLVEVAKERYKITKKVCVKTVYCNCKVLRTCVRHDPNSLTYKGTMLPSRCFHRDVYYCSHLGK